MKFYTKIVYEILYENCIRNFIRKFYMKFYTKILYQILYEILNFLEHFPLKTEIMSLYTFQNIFVYKKLQKLLPEKYIKIKRFFWTIIKKVSLLCQPPFSAPKFLDSLRS